MQKQKIKQIEKTPLKGIKPPACFGSQYEDCPACYQCLLVIGCVECTKNHKYCIEHKLIPERDY